MTKNYHYTARVTQKLNLLMMMLQYSGESPHLQNKTYKQILKNLVMILLQIMDSEMSLLLILYKQMMMLTLNMIIFNQKKIWNKQMQLLIQSILLMMELEMKIFCDTFYFIHFFRNIFI